MPTPRYVPVVRSNVRQGLQAVAMVGTYSAIIAWNCPKSAITKDHLGFAVKRRDFDATTGRELKADFLLSDKRFEGLKEDVNEVRSDEAPFQRFRWNDYGLSKDKYYEYEIYPAKGEPGAVKLGKPVKLTVVPSPEWRDGVGVYVNRGVTSSRAYLRRFQNKHPAEVGEEAYAWLSRGLKESLLRFIDDTPDGHALHMGVYEFFDQSIAESLKAAAKRVDVHVVYHAKPGDNATHESAHLIEAVKIKRLTTARTKTGGISHNKFVVRLKGNKPVAVWTGTSNLSENAFYFQTNAALELHDKALAVTYEDYFQVLLSDTELGRAGSNATYAQDLVRQINEGFQPKGSLSRVSFAPVRDLELLDIAEDLIRNAKSCVFISAPFAMDARLVEAVKANKKAVLEYALSNNTAKSKLTGLQDKHTRFLVPSVLKTHMGKQWDAKAFGAHKIHTKMIIADPWSTNPRVLFGSSNHSDASCKKNDENNVLIEGDARVAAILTTEFMRMFDHYNPRSFINDIKTKAQKINGYLRPDSSWSVTAYKPTAQSHKFRDREVFSGED